MYRSTATNQTQLLFRYSLVFKITERESFSDGSRQFLQEYLQIKPPCRYTKYGFQIFQIDLVSRNKQNINFSIDLFS